MKDDELNEECDDGNTVNGDECNSNCRITRCGDNMRVFPEECDDGNTVDGDGCDHDCTITRCGNRIVTGDEECDDGNYRDNDGCSQCRNRAMVPLTRASSAPSGSGDRGLGTLPAIEVRGNEVVTAGEACKDGDTTSGGG